MFVLIPQTALGPQNNNPNIQPAQTGNNVNNPDSVLLRVLPNNYNYNTQTTTSQEDFQNFQGIQNLNQQIANLASPLFGANPYLGGYSKFQVWENMYFNPMNYGGQMYYQSVKNDPDLKKLILGIMTVPEYINQGKDGQGLKGGQKNYVISRAIDWFTKAVANYATGIPQASCTYNNGSIRPADLSDLIKVMSDASYSGISQAPSYGG